MVFNKSGHSRSAHLARLGISNAAARPPPPPTRAPQYAAGLAEEGGRGAGNGSAELEALIDLYHATAGAKWKVRTIESTHRLMGRLTEEKQ